MWIVKRTKANRHKCNTPKNWFRLFGVGSIWACDGCECAYIYKNGMSGDAAFWWKYKDMNTLIKNNPEVNVNEIIELHRPEIASG